MILLSVNRGEIWLSSPLWARRKGGGGGGWRREEGLKIPMCWANGFSTEQLAGIRTGQAAHRKDTWRTPAPASCSSDTEGDFQEVFMGCTIYAASPKALPADEARGQDRYYQLPHYSHPYGNCSQRIAACRARSVNATQEVHTRRKTEPKGMLLVLTLWHRSVYLFIF